MKSFIILYTLFGFLFFANANVQSEFKGPVDLKVWQHWQQSWNVEDVTQESYIFDLVRGTDESDTPFVSLRFKNAQSNLTAEVNCAAYVRTGQWSVEEKSGQNYSVIGKNDGIWVNFLFEKASECFDVSGERIVTNINFKILSNSQSIYSYELKPMYVRGSKNSYWANSIDPYSAHAGQGQISVATSISAENGWDKWNGILVHPTLNFVDTNVMSANSVIGLHRHENNQELYFIESGSAKMQVGVASRLGENYNVNRVWDSAGTIQQTNEFSAQGGWIEERTLTAGELSVIIPVPGDSNNVYFHGIRALVDTIFWTMGTKN